MFALESQAENFDYALENVKNNQLEHLITIFKQKDIKLIFKDFLESSPSNLHCDFCLCNPPFYDSTLAHPFQANTRNPEKRPPPHNCPTGRAEELACEGGEVQFVGRIIEESLVLGQRIRFALRNILTYFRKFYLNFLEYSLLCSVIKAVYQKLWNT